MSRVSLSPHVRHDWFGHMLCWLDASSMSKMDCALTNKAVRPEWFVQLGRLRANGAFSPLRFNHSLLRWVIDRRIVCLRSLELDQRGPPSLQDDSFSGCNWPALTSLDLRGPRRRTTQSARFIPFHPPASHLQVRLSNVDHLSAGCPNLVSVWLVGEGVHDLPAAIDLLTQRCAKSLEALVLESCRHCLSDDCLGFLARLQRLRSLTLQGAANISDAGLASLLTLAPPADEAQPAPGTDDDAQRPPRPLALVALNLNQCSGLTSKSLLMLAAACSALETLAVADCELVTDAAVAAVAASNTGLRELVLNRCYRLTDAACTALATLCPRLRACSIQGCVNITEMGVAPLRLRRLPAGEAVEVFV